MALVISQVDYEASLAFSTIKSTKYMQWLLTVAAM